LPSTSLIGPAGVGKTRLALRAAANLRRAFPDGVWVTELADLRDPALLADTVAGALGPRDTSTRWLVSTLADFLATKRLFLILGQLRAPPMRAQCWSMAFCRHVLT
jgi:predicted ATPase